MANFLDKKISSNKIFLLSFYLMIFSELFNTNRFVAAIRFTLVPTLLAFVICITCRNKRKCSFSLNSYIPLVFVGIITAVSVYLSDVVSWTANVTAFYIYGLLFVCMTYSDFEKEEIQGILKFYIFLCFIISTQIYYNVITNRNYSFGRVSFSWLGVIKDQNMVSAFLAFGALTCFLTYLYNRKTMFLVLMIYIFSSMIMVGSRGGILTLTISSFIVLLKWLLDNESLVRKIFVVSMIFVTLTVLIMVISSSGLFDRALTVENYTQDGRTGLWRSGMKAFYNRPLIGSGYDSGSYYSAQYWNLGSPTHNSFLDLLTSVGILGVCAYLIFIIKNWIVEKNSRMIFLGIVISLFLPLFFINGYGTITFMSPCALVTIIARYCKKESIKDIIPK